MYLGNRDLENPDMEIPDVIPDYISRSEDISIEGSGEDLITTPAVSNETVADDAEVDEVVEGDQE